MNEKTNDRIKYAAAFLALASVLIFGLAYAQVFTNNPNAPTFQALNKSTSFEHTITVSGTGTASVSPDEAIINLGVTSQASTAQAAANQSARVVNNVISRLEGLGIGSSQIVTVYYNIYPSYNYNYGIAPVSVSQQTAQPAIGTSTAYPQPVINGYSAQYELQVTLQNSNSTQLASKAASVIDTAIGAGSNQVSGVEFTLSRQATSQINNQTLVLAVQDAHSKAYIMAKALGVSIVGVQSATDIQYYSPIYYGAYPQVAGVTKSIPILPGNFSTSASVQVTYIIQ